jgi:hypothetical protein
LTRQTLGSWVEEVVAGDPVPHLMVPSHGHDLLEASLSGVHELPTQTGHDPGCYRFFLDPRESDIPPVNTDSALSFVARRVIDVGREYRRVVGIELDASIDTEVASRLGRAGVFGKPSQIRLNDGRQIPTVGPGGHIALGRRELTVFGTSSVRPFAEDRDLWPWLGVDSVIAALAGLLDAGLHFDAAFGYYEKTWMERQELIEPMHAFLIEDDSTEYPLKREITMPATATS